MYFRRRRPKSNFSVLRRDRDRARRADDAAAAAKVVDASAPAGTAERPTVVIDEPRRSVDGSCQHLEPIVDAVVEFDDGIYETEVLRLAEGLTEELLDQKYGREARELGVDWSQDDKAMAPAGHLSASESASTLATDALPSATSSRASRSTGMTSRLSNDYAPMRARRSLVEPLSLRRSLSFTEYERFLAQAQLQDAGASPTLSPPPIPADLSPPDQATLEGAPSIFSMSSRKSNFSLKKSLRRVSIFRKPRAVEDSRTCVNCQDDVDPAVALHALPCGHGYCEPCLHALITQAMQEHSSMPPKCCNKPVAGALVKSVLDHKEQQHFMQSVLKYVEPSEDRMVCPNSKCRAFISKPSKLDPRSPWDVACRKCGVVACRQCRKEAHPRGDVCPADWELDAVLQLGDAKGWRRCYKCRVLVQSTPGCHHMTCRCKARFCHVCGAIWDKDVGCPNACNGAEEVERRRLKEEKDKREEEKKAAEQEAAREAMAQEAREAAQRSAENVEMQELRKAQLEEMDRFLSFEQRQNWLLWKRHAGEKTEMLELHTDAERKMKERHAHTAATLEDRQVSAEMELREALTQEKKSCQVRLRHMEGYCDRINAKAAVPGRVVTERDLRELGQQYGLRDDMERMHQSRVNVLREKQAQQLEALAKRQDEEWQKVSEQLAADLEALEERFAREKKGFDAVFGRRRERLGKRWNAGEEILRKRVEERDGPKLGPLPPVEWHRPATPAETVTPGATSWVLI
ncbi:MAG: hypothetical protein M1832_003323 [Thelocarpon impressellum]|nr:MAG: hypothetical protein M1832_003323 [Thelocarpon impressellum]